MSPQPAQKNLDRDTVEAFGSQWKKYDQKEASPEEQQFLFNRYFSVVDWDALPPAAKGFDAGCGTGRWAVLASEKLGHLHCIDASPHALQVAMDNLSHKGNCSFHNCTIEEAPVEEGSLDFGYSLGVLHHMPDTRRAIADCVKFLKPGGQFLVYLYYSFDNKPVYYRLIWKASELVRRAVTALPVPMRNSVCEVIAALFYFPLARTARLGEMLGLSVDNFPLSDYRNTSFYRMRHNARDRFGTGLEQRFSKAEIKQMMEEAGLADIRFREEGPPYWCAIGTKS